jgi:hypothetical protein
MAREKADEILAGDPELEKYPLIKEKIRAEFETAHLE